MNLLLKTTLKNTFGKPLRSILVIFSIFVCSLAALFCFDLVKMEKGAIENLMSDVTGDADISVSTFVGPDEKMPEGLPENRILSYYSFDETLYEDIEGEYYVVTTDSFDISGVNPLLASEMGFLDITEIPTGSIVVTDKYADEFGYSVGDKIEIHDKAGDLHEFTILEIVKADGKKRLFSDKNGVVNEEDAVMLSCGKTSKGILLIDILDDTQIADAKEKLEEEYGKDNVMSFELGEEMEEIMAELYGMLFILFAVAFLLVIFVTASICDRIVIERMSFIGTLRSLGMSTARTVRILLMENVAYALLGSIPGVALYMAIRPTLEKTLFDVSSMGMEIDLDIPEISGFLVAGVVIGAVLVECLIPLRAILKAMKTSIRDIIFDNRDTEYKFSKSGIITGFVFLILGVVLFFGKSLLSAGICLILVVISLALLYPLILKGIIYLLDKLAEKTGDAKTALALREAITRKSTVGSGVMCATAAAMCIIIIGLSTSLSTVFDADVIQSDVEVACTTMSKYFSFVEHLDGVTDVENVYFSQGYIAFSEDEKEQVCVTFGYPEGGYKYYHGLHEMPDRVEDGTICVEKAWASRNGKAVGDTVDMIFDPTGVFPIKKSLKIASFFKMDTSEGLKNNFVISESDYLAIFHDKPGYILVNSDNPEITRDDIKKYAVGRFLTVRTKQEIVEETERDNAMSKRIYDLVIAVALLMTFIGIVSNQTIGFEGRKKECAVMLSTSMTKKTLAGILFREMFITSFVSATIGTLAGMLLFGVLSRAIDNSENLVMPIDFNYITSVKLWIMMTVIFTLSVLFPIKHMRKMKLSEQLKYE